VESNETFAVNLSAATNATIGDGQGTGTIQNDDNPPTPIVSIGNVARLEGTSATSQYTFTVSLSVATSNTVTVHYSTANGTATAGGDYTATSGTVTFNPGATQKTITVLVAADTTAESTETFAVNLSSPTNATVGDGSGQGAIHNDDLGRDRFETNNLGSKAKHLGRFDTLALGNVSLHRSGDKDFYSFRTLTSGTFKVTVTPTVGSGTLNVAILNPSLAVIASGASQAGAVTVTLNLVAGQKYYLRVASAASSTLIYGFDIARQDAADLLPDNGDNLFLAAPESSTGNYLFLPPSAGDGPDDRHCGCSMCSGRAFYPIPAV
jgi:hypothetical protein